MTSTYYDPDKPQPPEEWLAIPETERTRLVMNFHSTADRSKVIREHSWGHVVVENYLAQGHGPARRALHRLIAAGVTRHQAVHVLAEAMGQSYQLTANAPDRQQAILAEVLDAVEQVPHERSKNAT